MQLLKKNYLVLGTDNLVEMYIGYFTKYGDGGVDLLPIVNLSKTQVYNLAKELGINEEILNKAPSAGLWENQKMKMKWNLATKILINFTR